MTKAKKNARARARKGTKLRLNSFSYESKSELMITLPFVYEDVPSIVDILKTPLLAMVIAA